jgi:restriction endonuclease
MVHDDEMKQERVYERERRGEEKREKVREREREKISAPNFFFQALQPEVSVCR